MRDGRIVTFLWNEITTICNVWGQKSLFWISLLEKEIESHSIVCNLLCLMSVKCYENENGGIQEAKKKIFFSQNENINVMDMLTEGNVTFEKTSDYHYITFSCHIDTPRRTAQTMLTMWKNHIHPYDGFWSTEKWKKSTLYEGFVVAALVNITYAVVSELQLQLILENSLMIENDIEQSEFS